MYEKDASLETKDVHEQHFVAIVHKHRIETL